MLSNMDILLLNKIPIKSLCKIVTEYCYHPRPYVREMNVVAHYIKQTMDDYIHRWKDIGCTSYLIFKQGRTFVLLTHFIDVAGTNKFILLERENKRRESFGLKTNEYLFYPYHDTSVTNNCYICY